MIASNCNVSARFALRVPINTKEYRARAKFAFAHVCVVIAARAAQTGADPEVRNEIYRESVEFNIMQRRRFPYFDATAKRLLAEPFRRQPSLIRRIQNFAHRRSAAGRMLRARILLTFRKQLSLITTCIRNFVELQPSAFPCFSAVLQDHSTDNVTISAVIIPNSRLHSKFRRRACTSPPSAAVIAVLSHSREPAIPPEVEEAARTVESR